jgi:hypothetical protein
LAGIAPKQTGTVAATADEPEPEPQAEADTEAETPGEDATGTDRARFGPHPVTATAERSSPNVAARTALIFMASLSAGHAIFNPKTSSRRYPL